MTTVRVNETATKVIEDYLDNGGAMVSAVNPNVFQSTWGYVVALKEYEDSPVDASMLSDEELQGYVETFITKNRAVLASTNRYVGAWFNTGFMFLDVVTIERDKDEAMSLARENGQSFVFDLYHKITVPTEGV